MKILTAAQMREMDRLTVEQCGIPYDTLMETAGARVVEAIISFIAPDTLKALRCTVLCGKGNNGGDGAVIARLLFAHGARVGVFLLGRIEDTQGEARKNFETIRRLSDSCRSHQESVNNLSLSDAGAARQLISDSQTDGRAGKGTISFDEIIEEEHASMYLDDELIVDALLGTGITRPVVGMYAKAVESINACKENFGEYVRVVSVDIPSGLSSDAEQPPGPHVRADLTVSFTAPKPGNVLSPACYANGQLVVAGIGTPHWLIEQKSGSQSELAEEKQIAEFLHASRRAPDAHKGSVGDVLLIAGSRGRTGAAALSAEAILRAGAGLVTVATAVSAQSLLVTQSRNEVMTEPLPETESGAVARAAIDRAVELARKRTVIAIGPGLSAGDESTRRFVIEFVHQRTAPLIIDADGLNGLAPWPEALRGSSELPIIITPHPGEMARLTGKTNAEIVAERLSIAREFAIKHQIITVLKGSRTIIAAPDGSVRVNPTGNAGMATAGSGDVLTGLIAGLLAQKPDAALQATIAAVYLHGLAGDIAANQLGLRSLMAGDITQHLSAALLQVGGEAEKEPRMNANWRRQV